MHIPSPEIVRFVLMKTLRGRKVISQRELASIVARELAKAGDYSISGRRVRMIALETPGVRVRTHTKQGPVPRRCPSCAGALSRSYSRNLRGRKVLSGVLCRRCGYAGSNSRFAPLRYDFELVS
jgi:ribosomal protein L34